MIRIAGVVLCGFACLISAPSLFAADFAIDLQVDAGKTRKTSHAHTAGLSAKPEPRALLEIKAGQRVRAHWKLRCTATAQPVKDVLVHFFVVREPRVGQQAVPKLGKTVTVESALTMDFQTGSKSEGELEFVLNHPGAYLVRLETMGAAGGRGDAEPFADMDVKVR